MQIVIYCLGKYLDINMQNFSAAANNNETYFYIQPHSSFTNVANKIAFASVLMVLLFRPKTRLKRL